jgi:hypothetical protein
MVMLTRDDGRDSPNSYYDAKEVVMYFRNDPLYPPDCPVEGDIVEVYVKRKQNSTEDNSVFD